MTNHKKSKTIINVGVDVGKQFLDVCIYEKGLHWQEENTAQGIKSLLKRLAHYQVERLVRLYPVWRAGTIGVGWTQPKSAKTAIGHPLPHRAFCHAGR